jgi:hypothetical protein
MSATPDDNETITNAHRQGSRDMPVLRPPLDARGADTGRATNVVSPRRPRHPGEPGQVAVGWRAGV